MPDRIDPKNIGKIKPDLISKNIKTDLVTDLNIVLTKVQIEKILKDLIDAKAFDPGNVALFSDYCCVDGAVGSSVAGPFSSVGSSVSYDPNIKASRVTEKLTAEKVKVNVTVPQNIKIK